MGAVQILERGCVQAFTPPTQLLDRSIQIDAKGKSFQAWSGEDHADSYHMMQQIAQAWKGSNQTDQYLMYGKADAQPFHWEMAPYQKCRTVFGRVFQQLKVLWRVVFGGATFPQYKGYKSFLDRSLEIMEPRDIDVKGNDAFCQENTIARQCVITGKKVNVLFNYAPIGFGGERLHFLVVPKRHRIAFTDVTKEEYCEALSLTHRLIEHLGKTRKNLKSVYLLNKTGKDAGQTVDHWHLHVIVSTNAAQDFWGKLTVFKNILLGASPMKKQALAKIVDRLKRELYHIR